METKQISFGEFDNIASDYLSELVHELLYHKGIDAESFGFSIEVEYMERESQERTRVRKMIGESMGEQGSINVD